MVRAPAPVCVVPIHNRVEHRTYVRHFTNGIVATMTLGTDRVPHVQVEWSERPTPGVFPEYFAWRHTALEDFSRRTGLRFAVVDLA